MRSVAPEQATAADAANKGDGTKQNRRRVKGIRRMEEKFIKSRNYEWMEVGGSRWLEPKTA